MRRIGGLLVNLLLVAATLAVIAGVGELALRASAVPGDRVERDGAVKYRFNPYRGDGVLGYTLRPSWQAVHEHDDYRVTVHTNELGLRGGPAVAEKAAGVYRVLVLGDSFAFGFGVEDDETFSALLQEELPVPAGFERVEVLNAGVAGWSTDHQWLFLATRGFALEPDLILLAMTENDPGDLRWDRLTTDASGLPLRIESTRRMIDQRGRMRYLEGGPLALPELPVPGRAWLATHSQLYHWLRFRLAKLWIANATREELRRLREQAGEPPTGPIAELSQDEIQRGLWSGGDFPVRYHRHLLEAIRRECAAREVPFRILLVAFAESDPANDPTARALHADCATDADCLLSSDALGDADAPLFFPADGHWTPAGHARIANALAGWLSAPGPPTAPEERRR